ncbi:hypothetical protein O6H91_07G112500 [Diphasiastrum complanatum]|uniref:Uncharacterized protein n=1 Tax=Diphasiastrum complanatum TaxID=34168 RepID=A0ACC2D8Y4_DIPCM|nr:hypothetical protein O6H91_07G112500 [Diphasiastrum complanatum]
MALPSLKDGLLEGATCRFPEFVGMAEGQKSSNLHTGDHVSWKYGAGEAKGHVVEKLTEDRELGSRTYKATPEDPKYLLQSDKSGKEAIHKGETLSKEGDGEKQ